MTNRHALAAVVALVIRSPWDRPTVSLILSLALAIVTSAILFAEVLS
jgi:hypothetical protein